MCSALKETGPDETHSSTLAAKHHNRAPDPTPTASNATGDPPTFPTAVEQQSAAKLTLFGGGEGLIRDHSPKNLSVRSTGGVIWRANCPPVIGPME